MLAYCWPIVYDHGSAVKQHWLKVSFLQGTPATQYPDTMLVQCWKSVIDNGTTFNKHWVSASQKEAVTSAERKYILDLQVNKYGLLAALWQEETGRQLLEWRIVEEKKSHNLTLEHFIFRYNQQIKVFCACKIF